MHFSLVYFSSLRYSFLQAKRQLGRKMYDKVATFMRHDANTAKRFYQGYLNELNSCKTLYVTR